MVKIRVSLFSISDVGKKLIPITLRLCYIYINFIDSAWMVSTSSSPEKHWFYSDLSEFEKDFFKYHYRRLMNLSEFVMNNTTSNSKILNIGLSVFDLLMNEQLGDERKKNYFVAVPNAAFLKNRSYMYDRIPTILFDLCNSDTGNETVLSHKFDFVIFSGVMEHLFCDDIIAIKKIQNILTEKGMMYISVPNAVKLSNRFRVMMGKNIHWSKNDIIAGTDFGGFGHIREYTKYELRELLSVFFRKIEFFPVNDYPLRLGNLNLTMLNIIIPTSLSIDISALCYR